MLQSIVLAIRGKNMATFTKYKKPNVAQIDKAIVSIAQGDDTALQLLYDQTASSIYAYALSVTKSAHDAQDVMHDTFIKVYENAHNYVSHGKPMAWILTIAKNLCFQKFRQQSRIADMTDETMLAQFADNTNMSADDKMFVAQYLSKLGEQERAIVVLHAMTGLKHREIAKHLDLPLATVLSKYHRAIKKLKTIIKGESQ